MAAEAGKDLVAALSEVKAAAGRYLQILEQIETGTHQPADISVDHAPDELAEELLTKPSGDFELGTDPETGHQIIAKAGRCAPYVTEILPEGTSKTGKNGVEPRSAVLFMSMSLDTVTLEDALRLMSLPRVVGADADGVEITAHNGRYGPYLMKGTDSRPLQSEDQIFTISLEEAQALYAQPKQRGRAAAKPPLKELGEDPVSGKPVVVKDGRYGPYVTDGETNTTLRSSDSVETITPERGFELLAGKRTKGAELTRGSWLESAAEIGRLSAEMRAALSQVNRAFGITSGREAILLYLRRHVGEPVPADALAGVSGIAEWARRVRELRVEYGWPIESGLNRDDMPHDHYRLTSDEPDTDLAERWQVAKAARNLKKPGGGTTSGKDRVLHYLQQISPREADKEQLAYVAKIQEWPRRMRELEEEGWQIVSNVDDPTLPPGSYRLPTLDKRPPRVRQAIKLRYEILERDKKTCQDCGRIPGQGVTLQVHHVLPVHQGGTNDTDNLVTLCSECHGGRHALMGTSVRDELLNPDHEPDVHED